MTRAFPNRRGAPPGSWEPTFQCGAWPHLDFTHGESVKLISPPLFACIRDCRFEYLLDQARCFTRGERQDVQRIARRSPTDDIGHLPCLARRRPEISSNRFRFHDSPCTLVNASSGTYETQVAANRIYPPCPRGLPRSSTTPAGFPRFFFDSRRPPKPTHLLQC